MRRGSPTTRRSGRSSARSARCRPSTTASTRASRRSTTSGSARRSARRSTGDGWPPWRDERDRPGRQLDGPARASPVGATPTTSRSTTRPTPASSSPRPAIRAAPASRPRSLMTGGSGFDEAIVAEVKRELGDHARARDDGRRLLRSPRHGPAGDLVARLGRGLPGPQRLPRRAARDGRLQQLRQVELGDVRRGDRRGRLGDRSGRRVGGLRPGRGHRPRRGPGRPARSTAPGWALSRTGLLGAGQNGLGIVRMAGLAWAD